MRLNTVSRVGRESSQSTPSDFHAASTSGPASRRKALAFSNDPLNLTGWYVTPTSLTIGAESCQSLGKHELCQLDVQYCEVWRILKASASGWQTWAIQAPQAADIIAVQKTVIATTSQDGPREAGLRCCESNEHLSLCVKSCSQSSDPAGRSVSACFSPKPNILMSASQWKSKLLEKQTRCRERFQEISRKAKDYVNAYSCRVCLEPGPFQVNLA